MMEVNQPIGSSELELKKINSSAAECLEEITTVTVQQNGIAKSKFSNCLEEDDTKCLEDDDAMEQLLYSEPEDIEPESNTNMSNAIPDSSNILINDSVPLDSNEEPNNGKLDLKNDTQSKKKLPINEEESSDIPPSSVQSSSEPSNVTCAEEEYTNGGISIPDDEISMTDELEALPVVVNSAATSDILEDDEENILLEADDDTEMEEPDETILLEEMDVDEECSTRSSAAIPIDDSSIVSAEITAAGDSSAAAVDESALSILNTAAVDIDDMAADESVEITPPAEKNKSAVTPVAAVEIDTVIVDESFAVISTAVEERDPENPKPEETPVFTMIEEMVTSIADNLKANESKQDEEEGPSENLERNPVSPDLSDLIKFPDVDELVNDEKVNACDKGNLSEIPTITEDNLSESPVTNTTEKESLNEVVETVETVEHKEKKSSNVETEETVDHREEKSTNDKTIQKSEADVVENSKQHATCPAKEVPSEESQIEVSDLIKFTSVVEKDETEESEETNKLGEQISVEECQAEMSDLIKFTSVLDHEQTDENDKATLKLNEASMESQTEVSDLIRFSSVLEKETTVENEEANIRTNEETVESQAEVSDLIKFTSVLENDATEPSKTTETKSVEQLPDGKDVSTEECQAEVSDLLASTSVTEVKAANENENVVGTADQDLKADDAEKAHSASQKIETQDPISTDTSSPSFKATETNTTDGQLENAKESDERLEQKDGPDSELEKAELSDTLQEKVNESDSVEKNKQDEVCTETVLEKPVEEIGVIDKSGDTEKSEDKVVSTENEKETVKSVSKESTDKQNAEKLSEDAADDTGTKKNDDEKEEDRVAPLEVCAQALQAADEEDLLEMMDEPERMDEDEGEEEPDDNSSESGSAKHTGDEIEAEDEAGSPRIEEFPDVEMEDTHIETEENMHLDEHDSEVIEGEPPKKRQCSIDIRESSVEKEVEVDKEKVEKVAEEPESPDKSVCDTAVKETKLEEVSQEKTVDKKSEVEDKVVLEKEPEKSEDSKEETIKENKDEKNSEVEVTTEDKITSDETDKKANEAVPEKVETDGSAKTENDTKEKIVEKQEDDTSTKTVDKEKEKDTSNEGDTKVSSKEDVSKNETKNKINVNDEILIIDDDDDVPSAQVSKKEASATKRPCPDDHDENENKDVAKKIRLSTEQTPDKKEEVKSEDKTDVIDVDKKEVKKSALELIEPIKIVLDPAPDTIKEKKPVKLEFMEKFKKPLEKMNRSDLEQFVLQKIVESVAFKSTIAEMRTQLDSQDTLLQGYRQKVHDLNKQFKDLEMVHERVVKDLEKKNQHFITPVKITRAVGLQVSQPRFAGGNRPSLGISNPNSPRVNQVNRSPAAASTPGSSPNKVNSPQNNAQNRRQSYTRVGPVVVNNKSPGQQQNIANRPGAPVMTKPSPTGSPATPVNKSITPLQSSGSNNTPANVGNQTQSVSTPLTSSVSYRKKPLQKFTPMRPPLSITQQVQQQQQTKQMQEQLMRQQIQDVQTGSTSGGSTPQSPAAQSPQGSPLTRTPEPSPTPVSVTQTRVPPILMKKVGMPATKPPTSTVQIVNRQTNTTTTISTAATITRTASTNQTTTSAAAPAPTVDNSLIDLTDEDDLPAKPAAAPTKQTTTTVVVPKPPITLLNGQQQQQVVQRQQNSSLPPLVAIQQQQRLGARPTLQQRPVTGAMVNGAPRPVLIQRPANAANTVTRTLPTTAVYRQRLPNGQIDLGRRIVARAPVRQQAQQQVISHTHPAPLPQPGAQISNTAWKQSPPRPSIRINNIETGIVISWTMDDLSDSHATIVSYQIYAYQETSAAPSVDMWRHVGDVKAMLLPMAVTLTQFQEGQRYHFAVRAVDEHQRVGQFSPPRTWNESTPAKA